VIAPDGGLPFAFMHPCYELPDWTRYVVALVVAPVLVGVVGTAARSAWDAAMAPTRSTACCSPGAAPPRAARLPQARSAAGMMPSASSACRRRTWPLRPDGVVGSEVIAALRPRSGTM
jgi:hypothetical protein